MIILLVFDMNDEQDRYDYEEMYHARDMSLALWAIRDAVRTAEKNDHSVEHLSENIRAILADLPESITG